MWLIAGAGALFAAWPLVYAAAFSALYIPMVVLLLGLFLCGGIVAGVPLWSSDPMPRPPSYAGRLGAVIVEIQIHAIFGLILLLSPAGLIAGFATPPEAWGLTEGLDQQLAGTLMWTYAELPLLIVLIVILSRWRTRDLKLARIRQSRDDEDLDRYNEYLAKLK